ncbi:hypothetical protein D3C84_1108930 [compost metagenome]
MQADEDMSDWRNWKAGDLFECVRDEYPRTYTVGEKYECFGVVKSGARINDNYGPKSECHIGDDESHVFKFHSRPSA